MRLVRTGCCDLNRSMTRFLFSMIWLNVLLISASAKDKLAQRIQPHLEKHRGEITLMIKHLDSGETFGYEEDKPMPTASLIKFPLMIAAYQAIEDGELNADQQITLQEDDKVPGSGILTMHFSAATRLSLEDAIHLMIAFSDNTATNLVIDQLGLEATAKEMVALKCLNTKLHSKVYRSSTSIFPERSREFGLGSSTAAEMIQLLELLQSKKLVSQQASEKMIAHMSTVDDKSKIPRLLPAGITVVHKTGAVSAARTDAGIVPSPNGPIAICVLTSKNKDKSWSENNQAEMTIARIAKEAYDYFNPQPSSNTATEPKLLAIGASGPLVETLQRTLNARLEPSPELGIDGDFGPMTEKSVKDFQRSKKLPETGTVDVDTWNALGTLIDRDEPVPAPEIVNAEKLKRQTADSLSGPPHVTCKAWAIGDADSGELLWGYNENKELDIASTTKIMTAYLVTSLAEEQPEILEEELVFSQRADDTLGSTSGIRAGEIVSVAELLYGLLLPSGNDASVALAEHFGARLSLDAETDKDSYQRFIVAMNRCAGKLKMTKTEFKNTSGLTIEGHYSTAADMLKLGYHAMQQPLFRKYVETPQHGCTVTSTSGYRRNLLWKNTNRLLKIEGYHGVKTGTTGAAGACLVSYGSRGDRSLILVVLGATSTDARYVDSRNLYRWAWNELGFQDPASD